MAAITITHTRAGGTLIDGSAKGDGVYEILRGLGGNWRYFPSLRQIGLGQSRDKAAKTWHINRAADALRAAGHDVTVTIDESQRRDMATIEADRAERAEARAEHYAERAERTSTEAAAAYAKARQMAEAIPFGQPILTDHYSAGRDRRYRDRIGKTYERAFAGMDEAERLAHRAEAAETTQSYRESVPVTLRRIKGLEADLRRVQRHLEGRLDYVSDGEGEYTLKRVMPGEGRKAQLEQMAADLQEKITYWREQVARAEAEGVKVWTKADFTKGDFTLVHGSWAEVLRVNAKSVTVAFGVHTVNIPVVTEAIAGGSSWTLAYDKVTDRKSAAEIASGIGAIAVS